MARRKRECVVRLERTIPGRLFRVYASHDGPHVVEVRIARNPWHMRNDIERYRKGREHHSTAGVVVSYISTCVRGGQQRMRAGHVVARMFLNIKDLQRKPSEIVAHECGHAAMAYARVKGADLSAMDGEEVLCYSLGLLVRQVNSICYAHGVWPR